MHTLRFGVQASLAGVPALAAATAAAGIGALPAAAVPVAPGGAMGVRPVLPQASAAALAAAAPGVRPPPAAAAAMGGAGPRPLRLDAAGREVDEAGNVIQVVRAPVATSLVSCCMRQRCV